MNIFILASECCFIYFSPSFLFPHYFPFLFPQYQFDICTKQNSFMLTCPARLEIADSYRYTSRRGLCRLSNLLLQCITKLVRTSIPFGLSIFLRLRPLPLPGGFGPSIT